MADAETSPERKHAYTYDELIACGHGELFGPGNAQLPLPPMLMFDRITHISESGGAHGRGELIAELDIRPDLWFFGWLGGPGHGRALGAGEVKFTGQVTPSSSLVRYQVDIKRVIRRSLFMGIADAVMEVDGRRIYEAKDLRVGLFTSTENF